MHDGLEYWICLFTVTSCSILSLLILSCSNLYIAAHAPHITTSGEDRVPENHAEEAPQSSTHGRGPARPSYMQIVAIRISSAKHCPYCPILVFTWSLMSSIYP